MAEGRQQLSQRLRIGISGLALVFLLVLLGAAITRASRGDDPGANAVANHAEPTDPLAEIGAAPGQEKSDPDNAVVNLN